MKAVAQRLFAIDESVALDPPLKWAGGKRWLVPTLRRLYDPHHRQRLVEPFVGGMAVSLGLRPRRALLNDVNPHLVNFLRWLKRGLIITTEMQNSAECFYTCRARFNDLVAREKVSSREGASLFYYLNRTGYNGLCRFNRRGFFNVPFGSHKKITYQTDFRHFQAVLKNWTLKNVDFEELKVQKTDFIYSDPPFDVEFTSYSKNGFSWADQVRLAGWLSKHPGPVVASNQATKRIISLYKEHGFEVNLVSAPRMISCTGDRSRATELLATRNL